MQTDNANIHSYNCAKDLIRRGLTLFKLSNSLTPAVKFGNDQNVINDVDTFNQCRWISSDCDFAYAVRTGRQPSGQDLIILDVDDDELSGKTGIDTLDELEDKHGALPPTFTVRSPSGGLHLYFWVDAVHGVRNSASKVGKYLDIRGHNGFVVGPGSLRSGRQGKKDGYYEVEDTSNIADMPDWLVQLCTADRVSKTSSGGTVFDLHAEVVPVGTRNDFFFRYASSLRGKDLGGDEIYALVAQKNNSIDDPLDDDELTNIVESAMRYEPNVNEWGKQIEKIKRERIKKPTPPTLRDAEDLTDYDKAVMVVQELPDRKDEAATSGLWKETLDSVFTYSRFSPAEVEKLVAIFADKDPDKIGKRAIKSEIKHIKQQAARKAGEGDLTEMNDVIVNYLLEHEFDGLHYFKRGWWMYVGTHWAHVDENVVHNTMLNAFRRLVAERFEVQDKTIAAIGEHLLERGFPTMLSVLTPMLKASFNYAEDADPLQMCAPNKKSYINFKNGTLWLKKDGVELTPHDPDDNIMNCLEYSWKGVGGDTPEWDLLCKRVFPEDTAEMQRHLEEVCGYILQNTRFLRAWFYFVGETGALKSAVASILTGILRTGTVARRFKELVKDNHGVFSLIGKKLLLEDDWPKADILPDGFLKTIAEEKLMTGNPKGERTINFTATVAPLICANNWIKTRDSSRAVHDRVVIIPFTAIKRSERSYEAKARLMDEIPDLIPRFVAGALRVMERGDWDFPTPCVAAFNRWAGQSTTIDQFISENIQQDETVDLPLATAYRIYLDWQRDNNPDGKAMGRNTFAQSMDDVLGARGVKAGRRNLWRGWKILSEPMVF